MFPSHFLGLQSNWSGICPNSHHFFQSFSISDFVLLITQNHRVTTVQRKGGRGGSVLEGSHQDM